jgi:hypothetical protein
MNSPSCLQHSACKTRPRTRRRGERPSRSAHSSSRPSPGPRSAAGDHTYNGGVGNDTFTDTSTTSNDTISGGTGSGLDTLTDAGGTLDHVDLFAGITAGQLKFTHVGNNLELSLLGNTLDKLTINGWYASSVNQIEEFRLSDGSKVLAGQVNSLVSAMAAFGGSASTGPIGPTMTIQPVRLGSELTLPMVA